MPGSAAVVPAAALPKPAAGSSTGIYEQAFTPAAARHNGPREERQAEGPRLSIGLLEVQIIQEAAETPQVKTQTHSPASERDELERSYIRSLG